MSHSRFRLLIAICLLLSSAALPLQAWAADTDGDGVDDSIDAFPTYPEATTDTDGDGKPDSIDNSKVNTPLSAFAVTAPWVRPSGGWSLLSAGKVRFGAGSVLGFPTEFKLYVDVVVRAGGGSISFNALRGTQAPSSFTKWTIGSNVDSCAKTANCSPTYALPAGNYQLQWSYRTTCSGGSCPTEYSHELSGLTTTNIVLATSALTLDTDDDNDGVADTTDKFPLNAAASSDTDNDGFPDSWNAACDAVCQSNSGLALDNCPSNANANQLNADGDAQGDVCDADDDNDGVVDATDKFPLDATETLDTDNDRIGNNADTDDDNDTVLDVNDNCPLLASVSQIDDDNDGVGNPCDSDGPGKLDAAFNPGTGANGDVNSVALQADGKVLIGGAFTTVNGVSRNYIARLNSDGSLDTGFNPGTGANGDVNSVALQADGKVLIGGAFTTVNGVSRNYIARLNTDGSLDTSFNPGTGANSHVKSVVLQADGEVLIGGNFTTVNGVARNYIARMNSDGSLDTGFNPGAGASHSVLSVISQADGNVLIGGAFTTVNGVSRNRIARLNSDGSLDTGFNAGMGANNIVYSVRPQVDGKVLIGGSFNTVNGVVRSYIARMNSDGSLDTGFNPSANNSVLSVISQADGKVLIGGVFTTVNGVSRKHIARLNSDGSLDTGFNPGAGVGGYAMFSVAIQTDGKALIGGDFTIYNGTNINRIARIHTGDADQDGIEDAADYFSLDPTESIDTDNDGIGNNADTDDDNDGVPDYIDAAPLDASNTSEIILPVNSSYRGSTVKEQALRQ